MSEQINTIIARFSGQPGPLLLVLHAIQDELGFIPEEAVPLIAAGLNLSRAEVHGVVTFYHHFRRTPPGKHVVQLCRAEACQSMHSEQLATHVKQRLGIGFHETTDDGRVSLEPVYCLGLCAQSPAVLLQGQPHARVTPEKLDTLLAQAGVRQ